MGQEGQGSGFSFCPEKCLQSSEHVPILPQSHRCWEAQIMHFAAGLVVGAVLVLE